MRPAAITFAIALAVVAMFFLGLGGIYLWYGVRGSGEIPQFYLGAGIVLTLVGGGFAWAAWAYARHA